MAALRVEELTQRARSWEEEWRDEASHSLEIGFPELRGWLSDDLWSRMLRELFDAPSENDRLRVLLSWYYSAAARARPAYWDRVAEAEAGKSRRYSSEELRQALGL